MDRPRETAPRGFLDYVAVLAGGWAASMLLLQIPDIRSWALSALGRLTPDVLYLLGYVPKGWLLTRLRAIAFGAKRVRRPEAFLFGASVIGWVTTTLVLIWTQFGRTKSLEVYTADATLTIVLLLAIMATLNRMPPPAE